jgi:hypothetical protein
MALGLTWQQILRRRVQLRMDDRRRVGRHEHRSINRDRQKALELSLQRAFPLPETGSFTGLLEAIDQADRVARRASG